MEDSTIPYNGAGIFNRLYSWQSDAANGIDIMADRMDNEFNGVAGGLSICLTRDGQAPMQAPLDMAGFKILRLGAPTLISDAMNYGTFKDNPAFSINASNQIEFKTQPVFQAGFKVSADSPQIIFEELDQTDPKGRWRLTSVSNQFSITHAVTAATFAGEKRFLTLVGGDTAADDSIQFLVPFLATITVSGATAQIRLHETDKVAPVGQYRYYVNNDIFHFQRATTADFATSDSLWSYNGASNALTFEVPANAVSINATGYVKASLEHQIDGGYMYIGAHNAATYGNGYARIFTDYNAKVLSITAVDGNKANAVGIGIRATAWEIRADGAAKFGTTLLNQAVGGTAASGRIATTEVALNLQVNAVPASSVIGATFRDDAGSSFGSMYGVGTSSPGTLTILTREKGDLRYALASSLRYKRDIDKQAPKPLLRAFDGLDLHTWTWGGEIPEQDERHGRVGVGFIAEEVAKVFPAAVTHQWVPGDMDEHGDELPSKETRINGLDPLALIALLVAKIHQMDARIVTLESN